MKKVSILLIAMMMIGIGFLSGCVDMPDEIVDIPDEILDEMVIVSFNVEPSIIDVGDSANLSWVITGTDTTPTINNGIGDVNLTGSRIITPAETTTYTLTATNSTSTKTATTQIIVRNETNNSTPTMEMVIVSFNVEPSIIDVGDSAILSWIVTGTDITSDIDHGIGGVSLFGRRIITPAETTTYILTATNSTSTKTATTQIIVRD
ncbi:MAG: hypothetical protein KAI20_03915 [Thermoplasmatales archaeon]|nr:hypothetical protein [Thermoplasmatales archaeon]